MLTPQWFLPNNSNKFVNFMWEGVITINWLGLYLSRDGGGN